MQVQNNHIVVKSREPIKTIGGIDLGAGASASSEFLVVAGDHEGKRVIVSAAAKLTEFSVGDSVYFAVESKYVAVVLGD